MPLDVGDGTVVGNEADLEILRNACGNITVYEADEGSPAGLEILAVEAQDLAQMHDPVRGIDPKMIARREKAPRFPIEVLLQIARRERPARKHGAAHGAAVEREVHAGITQPANHIVLVRMEADRVAA